MTTELLLDEHDDTKRVYSLYKKCLKTTRLAGTKAIELNTKGFSDCQEVQPDKTLAPRGYRLTVPEKNKPVYVFKKDNPFWTEITGILPKLKAEPWKLVILPGEHEFIFALRFLPPSAVARLLRWRPGGSGRPTVTNQFLLQLQKEVRELQDEISTRPHLRKDKIQKLKDKIREELREELEDAIREELREELEDKIREELREESEDEIRDKLREELEDEIRDELREELEDELRKKLKAELRNERNEELKELREKPLKKNFKNK